MSPDRKHIKKPFNTFARNKQKAKKVLEHVQKHKNKVITEQKGQRATLNGQRTHIESQKGTESPKGP
jgi:predicted ribosome quality control (RQC) complex YloA/Tae2 family protein